MLGWCWRCHGDRRRGRIETAERALWCCVETGSVWWLCCGGNLKIVPSFTLELYIVTNRELVSAARRGERELFAFLEEVQAEQQQLFVRCADMYLSINLLISALFDTLLLLHVPNAWFKGEAKQCFAYNLPNNLCFVQPYSIYRSLICMQSLFNNSI